MKAKIFNQYVDEVCDTFEKDIRQPKKPSGNFANLEEFIKYTDTLLEGSMDYGFRTLLINAHQRANYIGSTERFYELEKEMEKLTGAEVSG